MNEPAVKPAPKSKQKQRKCLQCEAKFTPKHRHNWICRKCRLKRASVEWGSWGGDILIDEPE